VFLIQAEDGIRNFHVTGVQTCALPILPMAVRVKVWEENKNAVSIMRGPLTYSLKIKEEYVEKDSKASAIGDSKWQEDADPSKWQIGRASCRERVDMTMYDVRKKISDKK